MWWLSWRLFRAQAAAGAVTLAGFAAYVLYLGVAVRRPGAVPQDFSGRFYLADALILVVPALLGLFWGAPLITREVEAGTHRLVWNQSVTRGRWLLTRLGVSAGAAVVVTGTASLLLSWAAAPYDRIAGDNFTPLFFGTRNLAPVAYALFAVVVGVTIGLLTHRTLPAMALTVAIFAVVQGLQPTVVRPHLITPERSAVGVTAQVVRNLSLLRAKPVIEGVKIPGGWVIGGAQQLRTADGRPLAQGPWDACIGGDFNGIPGCVAALGTHVDVAYQPRSRYWTFQLLESGIFATLALMLALLGLRRIYRTLN